MPRTSEPFACAWQYSAISLLQRKVVWDSHAKRARKPNRKNSRGSHLGRQRLEHADEKERARIEEGQNLRSLTSSKAG